MIRVCYVRSVIHFNIWWTQVELLYVKIIPTCWMNLRKLFLYRCYESNNLTCGEDLTFMEQPELKEVIFSISVVVSHTYYVHSLTIM